MRERYLAGERNSLLNTANLKLMQSMVLERAWGNSFGTFALITIRACVRVEYHALNAYKIFNSLLECYESVELEEGCSLQTGEEHSKYEIEAFLAASKTLLDVHLDQRDALLKRHLGGAVSIYELFEKVFDAFGYLFAGGSVVNTIRNSSVHNKRQLRDCGFSASIEKDSRGMRVVLPNLYSIDGYEDLDLAEMFCQVSHVMTYFVSELVRTISIMVDVISKPEQTLHLYKDSSNWRVLVSYGPNGFAQNSILLKDLPSEGLTPS